jgi:outer membrane protein assembly factor BamB
MTRLLIAALLTAAAPSTAVMQSSRSEWPQHLGPTRNNVAATAIPPGSRLTVAWKKPMPSGSAGIVVADGRAYTLGSDGEQDVLLALDAATGEEAWRLTLGPAHPDALMGPGSTPVISGDHIIALGTACQMQAIHRQTRAVAWRLDFAERFKSPLAKRGGCNMSPLLAGDRLVFSTGAPDARLAAVSAATGETIWTAAVLPSYGGSPGILTDGGGAILHHHVTQESNTSGITALDPGTGAVLWQIDGADGASGAVPIALDRNRLLVERWPHLSLYDLSTRAPVWTSRDLVANDNPTIHHKGHLFGFGGQSGEFMTCLDAATGKVRWSNRIYRGHLVLAGDTLVVLSNAAGSLRLVAPDPAGYRELAKIDVLKPGARTPTPPTVAAGRIFVRNYEEIVGISVSES